MKKLRIARYGYIAISMVFYLAALLYWIFPRLPPLAICLFSGIGLIAYGIIKLIGYYSEDLYCLAFRYDLAFGLLLLAIGSIVLIWHSDDVSYLPAGIGGLALLDSVLKAQMSEEAKRFGLEQWNIISLTAGITGILGMVLIFKSVAKPDSIRLLISLVLVSVGAMNQCVIRFAINRSKGRLSGEKSRIQNKDKGECDDEL